MCMYVYVGCPGSSAGNPHPIQETLVGFLGQEDPLEKDRLPPPVFWASLVARMVKKESVCNVVDLGLISGLEDPLEEGMATHSSIFAWRIRMGRGAWWATVHRVTRAGHD